MDIDKKDRSTLKSYFRKNSIPTESNFADLIDGMLNQKDDGIVKLPGDPLSIAAAGDAAGPQKVINFYGNLAEANPAWMLQLNPRSDQNKPETAQAGFSISDGQGVSRLFIDKSTGNVGIGTIHPQAKLGIEGGALIGGTLQVNDGITSAKLKVTGETTINTVSLGGFTAADADEWPRITWYRDIAASWDEGLIKHSSARGFFKRSGFGIHIHKSRDWGIWSTDWNPLFGVEGGTGNVSIKGGLHIREGGLSIGDSSQLPKGELKVTGVIGASSSSTPPTKGTGGVPVMTSGIRFQDNPGGGGFDAAWIQYYARSGENCTLEIGVSNDADDHIALMPSGNVGIGTATPGAKLEINASLTTWNGWLEAIRFTRTEHSAITHPGGGLLFGMHSDRHFYFADTVKGQYAMTIDGPTGNATIKGSVTAGNSDIYFTNTEHNHSAIGNTAGYAAIENAKDFGALMILGRAGTDKGRKVRLWDYLEVVGTFVNNSDINAKKDIEELRYGLEEVKKLRPVSFNWKTLANSHKSLGLIAQDVKSVIDEVVYADDSPEGKGALSIGYINLIPVLINAIKELDAKIKQLEALAVAD
ncbi:MAG: tail fiber domain-containing protein [Candidatus Competibacter sp.]